MLLLKKIAPVVVAGLWLCLPSAVTVGAPIDDEMAGLTHNPPIPQPLPPGPFQPTWASLQANFQMPQWFSNAKFGIFFHFGLYSIAAYHNEWYGMYMYTNTFKSYHQEHYGIQNVFGYKDFIPMFKAEKFDPVAWATLFKNAGAKYVVPVAEHHDGFAMYNSNLTIWCAAKMGPKRDIVGELANAVRAQGLVFGMSNHRIEHHTFMYPSGTLANNDEFDPRYAEFYGPPTNDPGGMNGGNATAAFQQEWLARVEEMVDEYHPQLVYFDNGINVRDYDAIKLAFAAYYYNRALQWGLPCVIVAKRNINADGSITEAYLAGGAEEYEKSGKEPTAIQLPTWETDDALGSTWGYVAQNPVETYRNASSCLSELITCASRGGNLLLNLSPMADGTIPIPQQTVLLNMGAWLAVNGDAIYSTHPWTSSSETGFSYTVKNGVLYAIGGWPSGATAKLTKVNTTVGTVTKVELLGGTGTLAFTESSSNLTITLPAKPTAPGGVATYTFKITGLNAP